MGILNISQDGSARNTQELTIGLTPKSWRSCDLGYGKVELLF